ncbi:MAG TPA: hypothetical protein VG387_04370 [Rhizomicrobium sp.]|jgi:hypothetical protein|nr:hypothetical protein [Rhizomicrobium sp.]
MRYGSLLLAGAALLLAAGCAHDEGVAVGVGAGGTSVAVGVGGPGVAVDYYDGYYDGYYGPFNDGYWGTDGAFYYSSGDGRWNRDDAHHFRHDTATGFNHIHGHGGAATPAMPNHPR